MLREFSSRKWSKAALWETGRQWDGAGALPGQLSWDHCMGGCLILQCRKGHQRMLWCLLCWSKLRRGIFTQISSIWCSWFPQSKIVLEELGYVEIKSLSWWRVPRSCISLFSQKCPDSSGWTEIINLKIRDNLKSLEKSLHLSSVQGRWGTGTGADICSGKAMKGRFWWIKCWRKVR